MLRYEVLTCKQGRWTTEGILGTRNAAVEHAQALADRNYLISGVRVMALDDDSKGFKERMVYNRTVSRVSRWIRAADRRGPAQAVGKPTARRKTPSDMRRHMLVIVLAIACAALIGYGSFTPQKPWVFDTPDAHKPHLLRNSFTGESS
jgi:hypothetical protein